MRAPHLLPALVATMLVAVTVLAGGCYGSVTLDRSIDGALAQLDDDASPLAQHMTQGAALQRAAFARPDLLPAYGASELLDSGESHHARVLLRKYATGIHLFPIAREGAPILGHLQKLAAVGPDARGKKVVISVSPGLFLDPMSPPDYYAGSFSPLHGGELAFSNDLGHAVKQGAARRMLEYPRTLADDPVLRLALESLATDSPLGGLVYVALEPFGRARLSAQRLQDEWRTVTLLDDAGQEGARRSVERQEDVAPDWASLLAEAEREYRAVSDNNPFGFWNRYWDRKAEELTGLAGSSSDDDFARRLAGSKSWNDLDLVLRGLRELGAEPLVVSSPLHGAYYDHLGVSRAARAAYYERLRALTGAHGVRLADFADAEDDRYFATDQWGHLSPKGWVSYARILYEFHRGVPR